MTYMHLYHVQYVLLLLAPYMYTCTVLTKVTRTAHDTDAYKSLLLSMWPGILFLVWFNNFYRTTTFYWSYTYSSHHFYALQAYANDMEEDQDESCVTVTLTDACSFLNVSSSSYMLGWAFPTILFNHLCQPSVWLLIRNGPLSYMFHRWRLSHQPSILKVGDGIKRSEPQTQPLPFKLLP